MTYLTWIIKNVLVPLLNLVKLTISCLNMAYFTDTETSDMVLMGMTIMVIDDQNCKIYGPMIRY